MADVADADRSLPAGAAVAELMVRLGDPRTTSADAAKSCRDLRDLLVQDGTPTRASVPAAKLLVRLVADGGAPHRYYACQLLSAIAVGDQHYWLAERVDPATRRAEVRRLTEAGPAGRAQALRALGRDDELNELAFQVDQLQVEAYDVVLAGAETFARLLDSNDVNLQLSVSALVAWLPEARELFLPRLCGLVRSSASTHVRATAAISAGLLAAHDDPDVLDTLGALRQRNDRVEHWSACLGLAEVMSEPDDALVAELYECFWTASQRQPYWGFLSGRLDEFAALAIAALPASVAPARVEVILERIGRGDAVELVHQLLDAVIGTARSVDHPLSEVQRRALLAIAELPLGDDCLRLLRSFGVPATTVAGFRGWIDS